MAGTLPLLVICLTVVAIFNEQSKMTAVAPNPFENVILRVLSKPTIGMLNVKRNESGFITEMDGVLPPLMEWLAQRFSFKFIYLHDVVVHTEDSKYGKGAIGYIQSNSADLLLGAFPDWFPYNKIVDFSADWIFQPTGFLIPIPKPMGHLAAIVKPFQFYVWMGLFGSIPIVITVLHFLGLSTEKMSQPNNDVTEKKTKTHKDFAIFRQSFNYIVNLISNQSGVACAGRWLSVRVLVGTWCLACFILITAYSSVLISFVISPNLKPVITSVYDIPKVHGLQVLIENNSTFHKVLTGMVPSDVSKYQILNEQWNANFNEMLCNHPTQCLEKVQASTPESTRIYLNFMFVLIPAMNDYHKKSGQCYFMLAKEPMSMARLCLFLAKNSPFTEHVSRGVMELMQYGLIHNWEKQFMPQPDSKCVNVHFNKQGDKMAISLENLSGAFVLLLVGWSLAILAFLLEKIVYYHQLNVRSDHC